MKSEKWTNLDDVKMNSNEYYSEMITEFPTLKTKIESWDSEMDHFRMEMFSDYNIEQIKAKNHTELKRCFEFQESRIEKLNPELINALNVSYCESLMLGDCGNEMSEIRKLMTSKLAKFYAEYENYYMKLTQTE